MIVWYVVTKCSDNIQCTYQNNGEGVLILHDSLELYYSKHNILHDS